MEELKVRTFEAENRRVELELRREQQKAEQAEKTKLTDLLVRLVQQSQNN